MHALVCMLIGKLKDTCMLHPNKKLMPQAQFKHDTYFELNLKGAKW